MPPSPVPHILSRLDSLVRADALYQLHPRPFGTPRPSTPDARFAEEIAEKLRAVATSGGYLSLAAFFYEVIDILLNDLAVASNFSQAKDHTSVCFEFIKWLDETALLLDSLEPRWVEDFEFRGMISLLTLYGQLRRSAFGDLLAIKGGMIWVPEYLFPALRAVYRWAAMEPGEISPENVDQRFSTPLEELPVTAVAATPIRYWPESRKPLALDNRMRTMRYTRLVVTSLTFPGSRGEGRPQVRLMVGGGGEEDFFQGFANLGDFGGEGGDGDDDDDDDEEEEEEEEQEEDESYSTTPDKKGKKTHPLAATPPESREEEEEEEGSTQDKISPEFLGFFLSSSPTAIALLSQDEARAKQLKVMQRRHWGKAILVQGPVPRDSPYYARRDQASGWFCGKAERTRLNYKDGRTAAEHKRDRTAKTAARHLRDKNDAAFFQTHGLITRGDFGRIFVAQHLGLN